MVTDTRAGVGRSRFTGAQAQQTVATILEAGGAVFRERGYVRTSMNDIAAAAGISRANVYTYFRSKRDILIALGIANNNAFQDLVTEFPVVRRSEADLVHWVGRYLDFLDEDQSFTYVWHEAARDDDILRRESSIAYRTAWRVLGETLGRDEHHGMVVVAAFERTWYFWRTLNTELTRDEVVAQLVPLVSP